MHATKRTGIDPLPSGNSLFFFCGHVGSSEGKVLSADEGYGTQSFCASGIGQMTGLAHLTKHGTVGVITLDRPPNNALNSAMAIELIDRLRGAARDEEISSLVLIGAGQSFSSGFDLDELAEAANRGSDPVLELRQLVEELEDFPKPVVCAIEGAATGFGLEIAIACHYRVCSPNATLGFPNVKLGLIPAAGGTQRLPRLAGIAHAAEICASGNALSGIQARERGIVDHLVPGDLLTFGLGFAVDIAMMTRHSRRTRELSDRLGEPQSFAKALAAAREQARKKLRGRLAPLKAIDAVEGSARLPFPDGCRLESRLFQECLASEQFQALLHVSRAERRAAVVPGISADTPVRGIREAGIVGAGTMGAGIAMVYANAGIPVVLKDVTQENLTRGMTAIQRNYSSSVKKGRLTLESAEERLRLIRPALNHESFSDLDIVVEAVFEDLDLKRSVFADLDKFCRPDAVLASNTSTLDIEQIAAAASHPHRVVGHHFFAPPHMMRLIEIVRGKDTSPDVIALSLALAGRLGKVGVVVGNCWGFVGNRMYYKYQREAQFLVEEGAGIQDVDSALFNFGMAMGPFATSDLSGLDVGWRARRQSRQTEPQGVRRPLVADRLVEMGRLGQKTGAGWYRYRPGDREPIPDADADRCVEECAQQAGIARRTVSPEEIIERTIFAVINEGAQILEDGIALRAADSDIVFINGYGFPAHRGGPMWFADTIGLERVHERICEFEQRHGSLWTPSPLLSRLVREGKSFADFDRRR